MQQGVKYHDMEENIRYTPIGVINTPFQSSVKIPIQASLAKDAVGFITVS